MPLRDQLFHRYSTMPPRGGFWSLTFVRSLEVIAEDARLLRGAATGGEDDERVDRIEPILGQKLDQRAGSELLPAHQERRNRDAETSCRTGDEPRA